MPLPTLDEWCKHNHNKSLHQWLLTNAGEAIYIAGVRSQLRNVDAITIQRTLLDLWYAWGTLLKPIHDEIRSELRELADACTDPNAKAAFEEFIAKDNEMQDHMRKVRESSAFAKSTGWTY